MQLLDGKKISKELRQALKGQVADFTATYGRAPRLDVILVGGDPASQIYVRNKERGCQKVGLSSQSHLLDESTTEAQLLQLIQELNANDAVDGILVQLPLPQHLDSAVMLAAIDPTKDVDGFHAINLGRLVSGLPGLVPCTPLGCIRMLETTGVPISGANAVVVGRSTIVGKPMAHLLLQQHATVTVCHSRTRNLPELVRTADIVVAAVGVPEMIQGDWIAPGAIVIDVGINRMPDGKIVGDVAFESAAKNAAWITPVPGGVGPMTIACLLENTLTAARQREATRQAP
ncbi:MAG: bifunctional methylenetetrahydrofolate dehydrogenase/methenyltetrahydrofolate cyclohydrolase FolD [Myxococcales bacterium]|jgi:methylenetetrahydrofolate dehydrogenase (NADP+)/methenyltetrahydrofolate cyclohydrolase|nr:bifunctional methylenetetrahydrofolate dehydrogenase/methenyltetrahydrofolate cyclohydrolase FolD [Myxococcales bacterium]